MIITIIIMALAVTTAVFAVLYFQDRAEAEKYEKRADSLSTELVELKCQMARIETQYGDSLASINAERVAEFLRREGAADVAITEKSEAVFFTFSSERFLVDCRRLPQMIAVRIDWNLKDSSYSQLDVAERLALEVTNQFAMVKASVDKEAASLSFYIVSSDRTMAAFKGNFNMYMSIFLQQMKCSTKDIGRLWEMSTLLMPKWTGRTDLGRKCLLGPEATRVVCRTRATPS